MSASHTPEPWQRNISAKYPIYHEWMLPDGRRNNRKVAVVLGEDAQAEMDLRRIVAAINACAGISTEALERVATGADANERMLFLRAAAMEILG